MNHMENTHKLERLIVRDSASLEEALRVMDANAEGTVFVVDASGSLSGVLTDGDVRRHFLGQGSLRDQVTVAMTRNCVTLPVTATDQEILGTVSRRVRLVPLLDETRKPVDYASYGRNRRLPVISPVLSGNELSYLTSCIESGWISSQGPFVRRFEREFADYVGSTEALAVSNGTVALHLILAALGIGPGDEVIVPNLTFAASANAVLHAGAAPVFADVDAETWTLSLESVASVIGPRTRAIMPVHLYGQCCDMTPLCTLAKKHGLFVIEDAAEALGATYRGKMTGNLADAAAFSFFGNKLITTGEGGMVTFARSEHATRAKMLRDHGMDPAKRYWHLEVGYNYRLTNLQAAIGVAQLERIGHFMQRKQTVADTYQAQLQDVPGISFAKGLPDSRKSHWLLTCLIDEKRYGMSRDKLASALLARGIETRPVFYPLDEMPPYAGCRKAVSLATSREIAQRGLSLPSSVELAPEDVEYICDAIRSLASLGSTVRTTAGV
jgi:perosamine synthetase